MAKTNILEWDTTANNNTDIGGVNINEGCPPSSINNGMRETMAQAASNLVSRFTSRAAGYTALKADHNQVSLFTASATLSLTAAATLTNGWEHTVIASGGDVTIDPNGAETINGATTLLVPDGGATTIYCNGTSFYTGPVAGSITGESLNGGPLGGTLNAVINGGFDVAKRGTTLAAGTGFKYMTDRWARVSAGSTLAYARQSFATGVTMPPGNPRYHGRFTVVSVASATNYAAIYHAMEDVKTYAGKTVTVTFYAKADAAKNIGFELYQWFGLGGSPSSAVTGIGAQQCALTTSWQRFDIVVAVPSISGKTRGTDNNDHLELVFWFDAGSTFASRASSIGQQSGTYDIARVSVREGDCRNEVDPFCPRHIEQEEDLCARYFQSYSDIVVSGNNAAGQIFFGETVLSPQMRSGNATPAFTLGSNSSFNASNLTLDSGSYQRVRVTATATASGFGYIKYNMTADFEI